MTRHSQGPAGLKAPIAVALDAPDPATMEAWATAVAPVVRTIKIGLETYLRDGAQAVDRTRRAIDAEDTTCSLFLDLKLHDIPATVAGAARSVAGLRPDFLTVHASGGPAMVEQAARTLPDTRITAVTVLTSLSPTDLDALGILSADDRGGAAVEELVCRWASIAVDAGARAIVCSPQEVAAVRSSVGGDIVLITPGVRPAGSAAGDQQRIATPAQALAAGADLLVIGRPITGADDPRRAAELIAEECRSSLPSIIYPPRP
jgi:orotidine-5'-phosphate decarboxylase